MNYLDFIANTGESFVHPGGFKSTQLLMSEFTFDSYTKILEIGCGTGASTIELAQKTKLNIQAVDVSEKMLAAAKERVAFHQLAHQISFLKINTDGKLPFEDTSFDFIYAESVLAILEPATLTTLLKEIHRVLRKDGKFICNDLIWRTEATPAIIEKINTSCLHDFEVIQSCAKPAYLEEWKNIFKQHHFKLVTLHTISSKQQTADINIEDKIIFKKKLSSFFRLVLKIKSFYFNKLMLKNHDKDSKFLESFMFVHSKI